MNENNFEKFKKIILQSREIDLNWKVKSRKDRFVVVYEKTQEEDDKILRLINFNAPFEYFSKKMNKDFIIAKPNAKDNYNDNAIVIELISITLKSLSEIDTNLFGEKLIETFNENNIDENLRKKTYEFLEKNPIESSENIIKLMEQNLNRTSEVMIDKEIFDLEEKIGEKFVCLAHFENSLEERARLILWKNTKNKISDKTYGEIETFLNNNISEVKLDIGDICKYIKVPDEFSELSLQEYENINQFSQITKLNKRNELKKIIPNLINEITRRRSISSDILYTNDLLVEFENDLIKIIGKDELDKFKNSKSTPGTENILNKILENNLWILGYDEDAVIESTTIFEQKGKTWKPDLIVRKPDGTLDIYELKLSSEILYAWDNSHKSHYPKSCLAKGISQLESQHQSLLLDGNQNITKNDTLYLVIGNYNAVELDEGNLNVNEKLHFNNCIQSALNNKKINIKLLRNKYKNAKIIFYDELYGNK